jgi:hypothetical protein
MAFTSQILLVSVYEKPQTSPATAEQAATTVLMKVTLRRFKNLWYPAVRTLIAIKMPHKTVNVSRATPKVKAK